MPTYCWTVLKVLALPLLAGLIGWALGGPTWGMAIYALLLTGHVLLNTRHLAALTRYLHAPDTQPVPHGTGAWEDPFASLYAIQREQRSNAQALNTMLDRFLSAASAMPDGIVILGHNDLIDWCNPVAARHFGIDPELDIGQPIGYLLRQQQFHAYLAAQDYSQPLKLRSIRLADTTLLIQLIPFGDAQKLVLSRDISRFEQLEVMRRDFIANVSHELKTPLTVISGFLETIEDMPQAAPDIRQYCGMMLEQSHRMQRIIEALLTLASLESDARQRVMTEVNMAAMMQSLLRQAETLSAGRHRLHLDISTTSNLIGSEDELLSAFTNLITNAIRYTPDGGDITLVWEETPEERIFRVRDTGIGIAPEHINRLTERFYRVDKSRSRQTGGTGLGLSIVKHVLTRHQARLEIHSEPERGSTFSACFPVHSAPLETADVKPA